MVKAPKVKGQITVKKLGDGTVQILEGRKLIEFGGHALINGIWYYRWFPHYAEKGESLFRLFGTYREFREYAENRINYYLLVDMWAK